MRRLVYIFVVILVAIGAMAYDVPAYCTAPTNNTDGTALTDLVAIRFELAKDGNVLRVVSNEVISRAWGEISTNSITVPATTPGSTYGCMFTNIPAGYYWTKAYAISSSSTSAAGIKATSRKVGLPTTMPVKETK